MKPDKKTSINRKASGKNASAPVVKPTRKSTSCKPVNKRQEMPSAPPSAPEVEMDIMHDEIARRAYFTYLNAGRPAGFDLQHWFDAEAQLTRR